MEAGYTGTEEGFNESLAHLVQTKEFSVTLTASGWSNGTQTVKSAMLMKNKSYVYSPAPDSFTAYTKAAARCGESEDGQTTFYCDRTPTEDIVVQFLRIGAD
jgi:hypothetical protein